MTLSNVPVKNLYSLGHVSSGVFQRWARTWSGEKMRNLPHYCLTAVTLTRAFPKNSNQKWTNQKVNAQAAPKSKKNVWFTFLMEQSHTQTDRPREHGTHTRALSRRVWFSDRMGLHTDACNTIGHAFCYCETVRALLIINYTSIDSAVVIMRPLEHIPYCK